MSDERASLSAFFHRARAVWLFWLRHPHGWWFIYVKGQCIACGRSAKKRGDLAGVCGRCGGADADWTPTREAA